MEPLSPNDPLWDVLGKSKSVEPRPHFVQNVVRLARQTPQDRGWLSHVKSWFQEQSPARSGLAWAAVAAVGLAAATFVYSPVDTGPSMAVVPTQRTTEQVGAETEFPLVPGFEAEWKNLEQVGDLLAINDTSLMTDSEINMLLY